MNLLRVSIASVFFGAMLTSYCSGQTLFNKSFDYQNNLEWGGSILIDNDTFIVLASSLNLFTGRESIDWLKFDQNGTNIYVSNFGDLLHDYYPGLSGTLKRINPSTYIFGGGKVDSTGQDGWLVKLNSAGDTIFTRSFGIHDTTHFETFYGSTMTSDSGYALIGTGGIADSSAQDFYVVKTDSSGNLKWEKTYGGTGYDFGISIYGLPNNRLLFGGQRHIVFTPYFSHRIPWVFVTDNDGNTLHQKAFIDSDYLSIENTVAPALDGNYFLFGSVPQFVQSCNTEIANAYITKLDTSLNPIWRTDFKDSTMRFPAIIKQMPDSSIVGVGDKSKSDCQFPGLGWIFKLTKSGSLLWEKSYAHDTIHGFNHLSDFQQTSDGGYIICGSTDGTTTQDVWLLRLDSVGCLVPGCDVNTGTFEVTETTFDFTVYPNPATSQVTFNYFLPTKTKEAFIFIYDMQGRLVERLPIDKRHSEAALDIYDFASGLYACSLIADGVPLKTVKMIKE